MRRKDPYRMLKVVASALLLCASAGAENGLHLIDGGESQYVIVLNAPASPSERFAAQELQEHFKACTGTELAIVERDAPEDIPMIVLGCGAVSQSLGVNPKPDELGEQGYVIRTVTPHLVIAGTPMAGTLYGVYDFLESCLGVRWYAPGVTKTPSIETLDLPQIDKAVVPPFAWRHTSYAWPGGGAVFRARQRDNSGAGGADNREGVQYAFDGTCHSYFRFVSPDEFFDDHPEYFSEIGGTRRREETQLCLTNPDVLEIVTERMLERMARMPGVRQHNFSQMDWYGYCQCPKCTAMNERYGTPGGTQFWFVNQLAERTSKKFPDKLIGTLAYTYTEEPPTDMQMHPNVAVWLCHMFPSCDSHAIATCPLNAAFKRRALAWSKQCSHLYIWHYIVDFAHYYNPFPNFRAMAADMRFYNDIGVEGIYLQGMGAAGGGGEFSLLRPYYGMKLLWNPYHDADAILRDFLQGYYGEAWEPIWQYITVLHDKVEKENVHMHLYTNTAQGYLTDDIVARARELFDRAEAAVAGNETLLERVRVARMPLTYAKFFPRNGYKIEKGKLVFRGELAQMSEVRSFLDRMKRHGFRTLRESSGDPQQLSAYSLAMNAGIDIVTIANDHLKVEVVPFLGGRALRIIDCASGECVTAYNVARNLYFPFAGGEETRTAGTVYAEAGGPMQLFAVVERTDRSVALQTKISGFKLRRVLTLAADAPVLTITNVLTNVTDKVREARVRSHLELDLGELRETRVSFINRAGDKVLRDMEPIIAGLREGEHYHRGNMPRGAWTFTGSKGLQVTQTFDPAQVDFTWLYAYPEYLNELEVEVWAKPVLLDPGESMTFRHELDVRRASTVDTH